MPRTWTCLLKISSGLTAPFLAAEIADDIDLAATSAGIQGLREALRAADLNAVIDASTLSQLQDRIGPFRISSAVDAREGAQRFGALELRLAARGYDDSRTARAGELQGEERDATRSLNEHCVTGFDRPFRDEGVPSRYRRAGQGRGLDVR
jgi:hypothetical protein